MTQDLQVASKAGSLQLHITRFEGQALQLHWPWPAETGQVDLTQVLNQVGLMAQAVEEAHRVTLHVAQNHNAPALAVTHSCEQLRCSINGQKLAAGHLAWLEQGDVLDVGLCRLVLALAQTPQQTVAPKFDDVDLTALASGGHARTSVDRLLNAADALDDLLQATPWGTTHMAPVGQAPKAQEAAHSESNAKGMDTDIADGLTTKSPEDPLGQWHTQYLRRLQSPNEALHQGEWVGLSEQQQSNHADALQVLMQQSQTGPDLSALLGQDTHISTVLVQLDAHGVNDLFEPPESVNVLHLFAPEGWSAADQSAQVPLLSRQEHHGMALDSAVPLNTATQTISRNQDT